MCMHICTTLVCMSHTDVTCACMHMHMLHVHACITEIRHLYYTCAHTHTYPHAHIIHRGDTRPMPVRTHTLHAHVTQRCDICTTSTHTHIHTHVIHRRDTCTTPAHIHTTHMHVSHADVTHVLHPHTYTLLAHRCITDVTHAPVCEHTCTIHAHTPITQM